MDLGVVPELSHASVELGVVPELSRAPVELRVVPELSCALVDLGMITPSQAASASAGRSHCPGETWVSAPDPSPFKGGPSWTREPTLVAGKPDGVQRRLVGDVIQRFERRGFRLVGMKMLQVPEVRAPQLLCWYPGLLSGTPPPPLIATQAPESVLAEHYQDLQRKPFYTALIHYMSSGPMVAMVWEGYNVIRASRAMIGHTDSAEAAPGTIRGDFSAHISRNLIHASDSVEGAQREIQLWFQSSELVSWADAAQHSSIHPA
ncbi:Nucleoside diphosphate kinase, mitochondrial [Saguinus oedipus]|uniref:Nucleoside diphosphate kinase n=1 Tax=Saguinus oedipus TaxID=9490 RepID=A0ABQ9WBW2_SAGOE|nr:Nucleoside diphosphate kinase, mitochondrial [Saguinus oedipus]